MQWGRIGRIRDPPPGTTTGTWLPNHHTGMHEGIGGEESRHKSEECRTLSQISRGSSSCHHDDASNGKVPSNSPFTDCLDSRNSFHDDHEQAERRGVQEAGKVNSKRTKASP